MIFVKIVVELTTVVFDRVSKIAALDLKVKWWSILYLF
jgi:hypothetical protein